MESYSARGPLLLANPLYWLLLTGPAILVDDPLGAAFGFRRPGNILLLVGANYVAVGLAGVSATRTRHSAVETLAIGAVGAVVLASLVAWFASAGPGALGARLASLVLGLWPIALGAVAGAAEHWRRRAVVLVVAVPAVLQLYAVLLASLWPIGSQVFTGFVVLGLTIEVLVYDVVFAYPLYRYGQLLGGHDGEP